jgi:hypothetical protein
MTVMAYQTQDGLADYGFSIEYQSDVGWRAYIIFEPLRQEGCNGNLNLLYQSVDCDGRRYVNWSSKLDSLGDAKTVATLWAEMIQRYRRTQTQRNNSPTGSDRFDGSVRAPDAGSGSQSNHSCHPTRSGSDEFVGSLPAKSDWANLLEDEVA